MDLSSPDTWRWLWTVAAVGFGIAEMAVPGSFFMLAFAIGASVAAVVSFAGGPVWLSWFLFVVVSSIALAILVPMGRRVNEERTDAGVGAKRYEGARAVVISDITPGPGSAGQVRFEREIWRASDIEGKGIPAGTEVEVVEVVGTRLIVRAADRPNRPSPAQESLSPTEAAEPFPKTSENPGRTGEIPPTE